MIYFVALQAQSATLTIAQAFSLAYEYWQAAKERRRRERKKESRREEECSCERRGERGDRVIHARENTCEKDPKSIESVEASATTEDMINIISDEKCIDTSPSSGYNSSMTDSQEANGDETNIGDVLLIDLSSPKGENGSTWNDVTIVDTDSDNQKREEFEEDADKMMDLSFTE